MTRIKRPRVERPEDADAWIVFFSGGMDSAWCAGYAARNGPRGQVWLLHADTRTDWPGHHEHLRTVAALVGLPLIITGHEKGWSLTELIESRGYWPLPRRQYCTGRLKIRPLQLWIDAQVRQGVFRAPLILLGQRAEESQKRAQLPAFESYDKETGYSLWRPALHVSSTEVWQWHQDNRVPIHPGYAFGRKGGNCPVCIYGTVAEWAEAGRVNPELLHQMVEFEHRFGCSPKGRKHTYALAERAARGQASLDLISLEECPTITGSSNLCGGCQSGRVSRQRLPAARVG